MFFFQCRYRQRNRRMYGLIVFKRIASRKKRISFFSLLGYRKNKISMLYKYTRAITITHSVPRKTTRVLESFLVFISGDYQIRFFVYTAPYSCVRSVRNVEKKNPTQQPTEIFWVNPVDCLDAVSRRKKTLGASFLFFHSRSVFVRQSATTVSAVRARMFFDKWSFFRRHACQ